jgi:hypothetical protein
MSQGTTAPRYSNGKQAGGDQCVRLEGGETTALEGNSLAALIAFFRALDDWDRETNLQ